MEKEYLYKFFAHLYDKVVGPKRAVKHTVDYWRERIFASVAITMIVLGFFALIFSLLACFHDGLYFIAGFDIILYSFALFFIPNKKIPIIIKKHITSYVFYLIGIILLIGTGKIGAGYTWLFVFPIITGMLIGFKNGVYALIVNIITYLLVGIFLIEYKVFPQLPISEFKTIAWIAISVNFIFLNTIITITNGILIRGLEISMQQQRKLSDDLKIKNDHISKTNNSLRKEIKSRIQVEEELRKTIVKAEAANVAKTEFLSNISHEIRTPLNAIIGFSDIVLDNNNSKEDAEYLSCIQEAGYDLLSLINKILDMSKIDNEKLIIKKHTVNIEQLMFNTKIMFAHLIEDKGIKATFELHNYDIIALEFDEFRFKQIISNLVENALKFTDKGEIKVTIDLEKSGSGNLCILKLSVIDTGIGIDKKDFENIYEAFWQKDSKVNREYEGTGLGLALVKKLVYLMKGEIFLESKLGQGSHFTIIFNDVEISSKEVANFVNFNTLGNENDNTLKVSKNNTPKPEFITHLSNKYFPQIKDLEANMILEDIHHFAIDLRKLSDSYENQEVAILANKLITFVSSYELNKVKKVLNNISNYCMKISQN